jgi:biotin-[acetyl-CoA-carboxylase] ligase BirA-like protein
MSGALDQVFSSVSNGVSVFAVAVAASPEAFGVITILITVLFAVLQSTRGGLGIPLLQTANQGDGAIRVEGSRALGAALAISPFVGIAVVALYPLVGLPAIAIGLSTPFVVGQDVLRYVAMTVGRPHVAAIWDGVWCLGAVLTLVIAWLRLPFVTAGVVLLIWGGLGLIAFVAMAIDLRLLPHVRGMSAWLKANWQDRVNYTIDAGLEQTGLVIIFSVMSALMSADSAGALRGAMAIFAPIGIFGVAVQMVLIPESVRSSATPQRIWRLLGPTCVLTALATAVIGLVAYLLPPSIGFYLLGQSFEAAQRAMLPTTAWFMAACCAVVLGIQFKTFNHSRKVLTMKVTGFLMQLTGAIGAAVWIGTASGVALWLAIQTFLTAVIFYFLWPPGKLEPRLDMPGDSEVGVEEPVLTAEMPMVHETAQQPPLSAPALRAVVVGPDRPWRRLDVVEETGSTNADLLARAAAGGNVDGVVLIAEHQTAGRGRLGREWVASPRAQLLLSVGIDASAVPVQRWGWLTLAAGVAVVDAVAAETGVRAQLKWPNDVLVGDAKLAGVLAEVASPQPVIIVGVGLNVTLDPREAAQPNATSLHELGVDADRDRLASRLLLELGKRVADWRAENTSLAADYRNRSATIGAQVKVALPGEQQIVGTAVAVDTQGRIIVSSNGECHHVSAGDVVHLRPV